MLCPGEEKQWKRSDEKVIQKTRNDPSVNLLEGIICQLKVLLIEKLNMIKIIRYISVQEELLLLFFFSKDNN